MHINKKEQNTSLGKSLVTLNMNSKKQSSTQNPGHENIS